ncbi:MAG: acyl--CoA ligase [Clostridiales bacterium]|nr:acyl--CoA ligase [Clostridiales bacterium]
MKFGEYNAPWFSYYSGARHHLDYPDLSMIDAIEENAVKYPHLPAYDFMGARQSFSDFLKRVHICAKGLKAIGFQRGDTLTVCMPNSPQGVITFYAVNAIGGISSMIHPLSAPNEIKFYLQRSKSKYILTLDTFLDKVTSILDEVPNVKGVIVATIKEELPFVKGVAYSLMNKSVCIDKSDKRIITFAFLMKMGKEYKGEWRVHMKAEDPAVILYSGGTTGKTKGILLSNLAFNALSMQTVEAGQCTHVGSKMLAVMPMFHGFGLGVSIHTSFLMGFTCILVPKFNVSTYARLLKKYRPNVIAGVPTLFEALLKCEDMEGADLSHLEGVFCGGDTLLPSLKRRVDEFISSHNGHVQIREGYGLTECVTASCLTPKNYYREGSIGVPYPDTRYKIIDPNTLEEIPSGTEGEIIITGPTLMLGYVDEAEENASTIIDLGGERWLRTGDIGKMDEDGFVYYIQRLKRMIISSGYSIYPSQIEDIISLCEGVGDCCVVGVDDPYKIQRVRAYVIPREGFEGDDALKEKIMEHCKKNIAKYALPSEIIFKKEFPRTLVGKVAYRELEAQDK